MWKQRKVLKHHSEAATMGGNSGQVLAVKYDRAAIGFFQPGNNTQQRCFPAAGRPEKAKNISGVQVQIYLVKSENPVIILIDISYL